MNIAGTWQSPVLVLLLRNNHATIAIMYDLIKSNGELQSNDVVYINTNKGRLSVSNRVKTEDAVFILAPKPVYSEKICEIQSIADALHIIKNNIDCDSPVSIINAGLNTLIVPIINLRSVLSIAPDFNELKGFCENNAIDIVTVYTNEVADKNNSFRVRVFAPTFGYLEDPATGSGNSALGYYLYKSRKLQSNMVNIEQNGFYGNANIVKLEFHEENNQIQVSFGGNAVVRINGEYHLV